VGGAEDIKQHLINCRILLLICGRAIKSGAVKDPSSSTTSPLPWTQSLYLLDIRMQAASKLVALRRAKGALPNSVRRALQRTHCVSSISSSCIPRRSLSPFPSARLRGSVVNDCSSIQVRCYSDDTEDLLTSPRESMPYDVLIVGGGPAGLAASIRLKQLCAEKGIDLSVCVVEKGSEIGAHILSGNVFDPRALKELLPDVDDWASALRDMQSSHATPVTEDRFLVLSETSSYTIPNFLLPSQLHNDGNFVISLGQLCRWLASIAEEMGVEIYPGFAASEVLFDDDRKAVRGIATRDVGIGKVSASLWIQIYAFVTGFL